MMHHQFTYIVEPREADDPWYIAFCPEIPEANGQGATEPEAVGSPKESIELILEHRREEGLRGVPDLVKRSMVEFGLNAASFSATFVRTGADTYVKVARTHFGSIPQKASSSPCPGTQECHRD